MSEPRTANDLGVALCTAKLAATARGDSVRATRAAVLIDELVAAMQAVKAETDRVGLHWTEDQATPSGIRAWHGMGDDHDVPSAWLAAAAAFRQLARVHREVERALDGELRDLLA